MSIFLPIKKAILAAAFISALLSIYPAPSRIVVAASGPGDPASYPPDPTADIPWTLPKTTQVADIQAAFNNARQAEAAQLGITIPALSMPSQSSWDAFSQGKKAAWLINQERIARGVAPLSGLEANITSVSQTYAQYLLDNNAFNHDADGRSPSQRILANPTISACNDGRISENLFAQMSSANNIIVTEEYAIYVFMYADKSSAWGHRHNVLYYPFNENGGLSGEEGFVGIGVARGPYQGWPYGAVLVMDTFDPCATWDYSTPPTYSIFLPIILRVVLP